MQGQHLLPIHTGALDPSRANAALWLAGAAALAAAMVSAAAPPLGLWPLGLFGLAPLLLVARRVSPWQAVGVGWLFGFLVNLGGFAWAVDTIARFTGSSQVTSAAWVLVACVYQGSVFAVFLGATTFASRQGLSIYLAAPILLVLVESFVPFLLPWSLAITVSGAWPLLQVAELGGPPAVSALVVLLNLLLIEGFLCLRPPARRPTRAFLSAAAVVAVVLVLGMLRSAQVAAWRQSATILKTAIVHLDQGPLSISERQSASERLLSTLRKLNDAAGAAGASFIVWPESAFPHLFDRALDREYPREHPWHLARPDPGSRLLFGALSHDFGDDHVQNSAVLVSEQGAVVGIYDKQHLLAFGEYIPFSDRFPAWAARLRTHMPEFPPIAAGAARPPLVDADLRLGVFICYEELVPSLALVHARQGVNLLVTLANHVWLAGSEAARARAAALASFRAIETRRDLVRATNAGQTTFVDALGRAQGLASPASHHPEDSALLVVDAALIEETAIGPYTIPVFPFFCAALLLVAAVSARRRRPSP